MEFAIQHTWDSSPVDHEPIRMAFPGQALIPWAYFPPNVNKMNSYAVDGSGERRTHEALYPVPKEDIVESQKPNVHRLEYFHNFRLQSIVGEDWVQPESDLWKGKRCASHFLKLKECMREDKVVMKNRMQGMKK
ncbi:UPF0462 protein C4orf33 homolog [Fundulus diaphanus]